MKTSNAVKTAMMAALSAASSFATETVIDYDSKVVLTNATEDTVTLASIDRTAYPEGLPEPSFWFDASDTEGWTLESGSVMRIPSKTGSRSLSVDVSGGSWNGWSEGVTPVAPVLVDDAELGGKAVDFGAAGSRRALVFDSDGTANRLATIGTAVFVYGSQQGGGAFFGGGMSALDWCRSSLYMGSEALTPYNPLAGSAENNAEMFRSGYTRHNGYPFIAHKVGFTGRWEVFSFSATNDAAAATLAATGLGLGSTAAGGEATSGGMKIAEMIVFDEVLTEDRLSAVEDWLRYKWFGFSAPGANGRSRAENVIIGARSWMYGKTTVMTAQEGETLEIGRLTGGHNSSLDASRGDVLTLTGGGAFKIESASGFGGDIVLDGSEIVFDNRPVPTVDELPSGLLMRFDPSDASSRTLSEVNGTNYLDRLSNLADGGYMNGEVSLRSTKTGDEDWRNNRPWIASHRSPTGLPLLDFGPYYSWIEIYDSDGKLLGYHNRHLRFHDGENFFAAVPLTTVIALVDSRRGGGWLLDSGFQRREYSTSRGTPLLRAGNLLDSSTSLNASPYLTPADGSAYLDGVKVKDPTVTGYNHGMQVVALQVPATSAHYIGAAMDKTGGSLVVGEMLMWNRPLDETEIRDASAYLAKKWLGKTLYGYRQDAGVTTMRKLTVKAGSSIDVAEGTTVRIDEVVLEADLVKTGAGTLEICALENGGHRLLKSGGKIDFVSPRDVSALAEAAEQPAFGFDPTDTDTWEFKDVNGEKRIYLAGDYENDLFFTEFSHGSTKAGPYLSLTNGPVVAGERMPVADFGEYASKRGLLFTRPVESVRSVYAVWMVKDNSKNVFFMGSTHKDFYPPAIVRYDFHRGELDSTTQSRPLFNNGAPSSTAVKDGEMLVDGVVTNGWKWTPESGKWYLVEIHTETPVHISAFGMDRGSESSAGGMALGEVVAYDRELSEREKTATRNYLMKKWFGKADAELTPLPDAETQEGAALPLVEVDGSFGFNSDSAVSVRRLTGEGDFVKSGAGTLEIVNHQAFTGTVRVAEGEVKLSSYVIEGVQKMTERGLLMQLDAGKNLTTRDVDGRTEVLEWGCARGSGWKAVSAKGSYPNSDGTRTITVNSNPSVMVDAELCDRQIVDMAASKTGKYECFKLYGPGGEWQAITNLYTAFWVIGSQNGGGWLFGGGDHSGESGTTEAIMRRAWHRGGTAGTSPADSLLCGSGYNPIRDYNEWRINGKAWGSTWNNPLSGSWDVVCSRLNEGHAAFADALACDGRIFQGVNYVGRCGNQKLAELLVYTNRLTVAEIEDTQAYLAAKWGVNGAVDSRNESLSVELAEGAVLDCGGNAQYFASLSGAGTVEGDVSVGALQRDCAVDTALTVEGALTLEEGAVVTLVNAASLKAGDEIVIASAAEIEVEGGLESVALAGVPESMRIHLRVRGGNLVAKVATGTYIIVR